MGTHGDGLDAFESEIGAHPVLEIVNAYPGAAWRRADRTPVGRRASVRRHSSALVPAARDDGPPVIRVAIAGVPRWARRVRAVPAIALMLCAAAGISVGAAHVLSQRLPEPAPAPRPAAARPAAAPTLVTVIAALPKEPVQE